MLHYRFLIFMERSPKREPLPEKDTSFAVAGITRAVGSALAAMLCFERAHLGHFMVPEKDSKFLH